MTDQPNPFNRLVRWLRVLAALVVLIGGVNIAVEVSTDDNGKPRVVVRTQEAPPQVPTTVQVDGPDADGKLDDRLTVDPRAADRLEDQLESGQAELNDPLREEGDSPATTVVPGPMAADEVPGCRTRFVGNSSSRGSARPRLIFLHQTVSRENGWQSQNALTGLAARRASGVSWHLLVGRTGGRCTYTVPLALKAWTQANANPWAVGIEVEAFGDEGAYVTGAGKTKLLSVIRNVARRYDIPLRRGKVNPWTCQPITSGVVEHSDAKSCGGGHIDVTHAPADMAASIAAQARAGVPSTGQPRTATQRSRCGGLRHHRQVVRKRGEAAWADKLTVHGTRTTRGRRAGYLRRELQRAHVDHRRYCS